MLGKGESARRRSIHSIPETAASMTTRAAADTSGPMPSPGISAHGAVHPLGTLPDGLISPD